MTQWQHNGKTNTQRRKGTKGTETSEEEEEAEGQPQQRTPVPELLAWATN